MLGLNCLSSVFSTILYMALAIIVLLLMVLIHETGHYVAGRILKFKINEFSIGFGKAIFSKTNKRGEKISLRLFPLGGYCAFEGENDDEKSELKKDSFNAQKPWKRIIVYLAGVTFNLISAVVFSFILLVSFGYDIPEVSAIDNRYLNSSAFQVGDAIYEVDGTKIDFIKENTLSNLLAKYNEGEKFDLTVKRNGEFVTIQVSLQQAFDESNKLLFDEDGKPILRLGISTTSHPLSFGEALARCVPFTAGLVWMVLKSFWLLITFQLPLNQIGGPITTVSVIASQASQGLSTLLFLLPLIAANLGVFNLLPFPALDGAHVIFTTIEWIRKKPINRTVEGYIHFAGLVILFAFVILVDILHFVS